MSELDDFDLRILRLLQGNARLTGRELAEQVGLSGAACLRRVQRLRESGVIEREVAVVSPKVFGKNMTLIVSVAMNHAQTTHDHTFQRQMDKASEVISCLHVTGPADYMITVQVPDMEAYKAFTERYFYQKHIKRFDTAIVIEQTK